MSPPGHDRYFDEFAEILSTDGRPDSDAIAALRRRYDTEQLSSLVAGQAQPGGPREAAAAVDELHEREPLRLEVADPAEKPREPVLHVRTHLASRGYVDKLRSHWFEPSTAHQKRARPSPARP